MKFKTFTGALEKKSCDCLILGVYENMSLSHSAEDLDATCDGLITSVLKREKNSGRPGKTLLLNYFPVCKAQRVLLVGLGIKQKTTERDFRKAIRSTYKVLHENSIVTSVIALLEVPVISKSTDWKARQIAEIFELCSYRFTALKSDKKDDKAINQSLLYSSSRKDSAAINAGIQQGFAIAEGANLAKELSNLPGNVCTPTYLAEQAVALGKAKKSISVKVLEEKEMEKLGMGALLSVSKGSREPAKLIVMEYKKGPKDSKPAILVGKGLTFDAGGISIKPAAAMDEMKYDMCGGASVIGTLSAIATMELPINLIGIVASSENLPDGNANKPGDIVTSMSGKTIEILNTDAEGRLILCDSLTYAERYNPDVVIDLATLTGACIIALGRHPSGLLGNDDTLCNALIDAGNDAMDRVWRLPLWDEYQDQLRSNFADIANIGGRDAGTITAGCFLSRFTGKFRWAHIDIAGTAWVSGKDKGATGRPVPLLSQYFINQLEAGN